MVFIKRKGMHLRQSSMGDQAFPAWFTKFEVKKFLITLTTNQNALIIYINDNGQVFS
jgi:hypothetical protein